MPDLRSAPDHPSVALLHHDVSLRANNTFGFDVRARLSATVRSEAALRTVLADPRVAGLPRLVIGGGSNLLLTGDWPGFALQIAIRGRRIVDRMGEARTDLMGEADVTGAAEGTGAADGTARADAATAAAVAAASVTDTVLVEAGAGEHWHAFVEWTLSVGLCGLENLALIPGTVGAAPVQNIGAYGLELADRFHSVRAFDTATGTIVRLDAAACRFAYRDSVFKREGRDRLIITAVTFALTPRAAWQPVSSYADIARVLDSRGISTPSPRDIFDAVVAVRQSKLPDPAVLGNAGSFFKNPIVDATHHAALRTREPDLVAYAQPDGRFKLAAGWMIDQCGWKGRALGPAAVHDKQALVLVNPGKATGQDMLALAQAIIADVQQRFDVTLEPEPLIV